MRFQLPKRAGLWQTFCSFAALAFSASTGRCRRLGSFSRLDLLVLEDHDAPSHGSVLVAAVLGRLQARHCHVRASGRTHAVPIFYAACFDVQL